MDGGRIMTARLAAFVFPITDAETTPLSVLKAEATACVHQWGEGFGLQCVSVGEFHVTHGLRPRLACVALMRGDLVRVVPAEGAVA